MVSGDQMKGKVYCISENLMTIIRNVVHRKSEYAEI